MSWPFRLLILALESNKLTSMSKNIFIVFNFFKFKFINFSSLILFTFFNPIFYDLSVAVVKPPPKKTWKETACP